MYGLDGNFSALEWADTIGFSYLRPDDQQKLISSGHYTCEGHRTYAPEEKCSSSDTSTKCHIDITV